MENNKLQKVQSNIPVTIAERGITITNTLLSTESATYWHEKGRESEKSDIQYAQYCYEKSLLIDMLHWKSNFRLAYLAHLTENSSVVAQQIITGTKNVLNSSTTFFKVRFVSIINDEERKGILNSLNCMDERELLASAFLNCIYEKHELACKQALNTTNPLYKDIYFHYIVAICLAQTDLEAAMQHAEEAILLNSHSPLGYNVKALILLAQEQFPEVIQNCSKVIEINSNIASAYSNRGRAFFELEQYIESIENYSKAIEIDPNYVNAYYNRGVVFYESGDFQNAVIDFSKAIEFAFQNKFSYYNRALAYQSMKRYSEAIADFSKAIEVDPYYLQAYFNRGEAFYEAGQYHEAIEDYSIAIEIDPEDELAEKAQERVSSIAAKSDVSN